MIGFMLAVSTSLAQPALQSALQSSADWTMQREIPGSTNILQSSGRVVCKIGEEIDWITLEPFASTIRMKSDEMVFEDEDGIRTKPMDGMDFYSFLKKKTDESVAGDSDAFKEIFELDETKVGDKGWRLEAAPRAKELRRMIESFTLSGEALPTNAVIRCADGGKMNIRFSEVRGK